MSALSTAKAYTVDHAWQSGRDLKIKCLDQPIYWVVFHTARLGGSSTLSIHEKGMGGPVLCAGVLNRSEGFTYKTAGQGGAKHNVHRREGSSLWEQHHEFQPAKGVKLAWKQARPGQRALPTNAQQEDNAPALGQRDWILIAVNEHHAEDGGRFEAPEKQLAIYSSPKGFSQQARIYFVEELGTEMEVGALAVILGIIRWNYTKPAKMLSSSFNSAPAFSG